MSPIFGYSGETSSPGCWTATPEIRQRPRPEETLSDGRCGGFCLPPGGGVCVLFHLNYEPSTFQEAIDGPEGELWKLTADAEMAARVKNSTWTLVPLPPGSVCISSVSPRAVLIPVRAA